MRVRLVVRGTVQGVGYRPFVRRAAIARSLVGFVQNTRSGVVVEAQGDENAIRSFVRALEHERPAGALVEAIEETTIERREETSFTIFESSTKTDGTTSAATAPVLPPDLATCTDCNTEVGTRAGRRYRYPFTSCASCGPRYSISTALPYDRQRTSMRAFIMCVDCAHEYDDIEDRRHHAQPIACPACGPTLTFVSPTGRVLARKDDALKRALCVIEHGGIIAMRGLGGFQLLCDATDARAVDLLRARKRRPHKPFAVMFRDFEELGRSANPSDDERRVLLSPEAPIVLLTRLPEPQVASNIAKGIPWIGAMLPYTPLHALLLEGARVPLVCTSGNRSDEPICTNLDEAIAVLGPVVDGILSHDRPIVRPLDDSLVRVSRGRALVMRRARGYAPRRVGTIDEDVTVLAFGAHQKSTVTLGHGGALVPSQHLGDLSSLEARELLELTARDLCAFFDASPRLLACDLHPEYASSILAEELAQEWQQPIVRVQHHHAHVAAVMAEHELREREVLGLAWDGMGLGTDGSIWGGEALVCRGAMARRFATLRSFPLLGGERASREPRRSALGVLHASRSSATFLLASRWFGKDLASCVHALERGLAPLCSSVGRLFDATAAIVGLPTLSTFEGQTAMELEHLAMAAAFDGAYPFPLVERDDGLFVGDVGALIEALLQDARSGVDRARMARRFHEALIALGVAIAERAGICDVVLSGGCFQNHLLLDGLQAKLGSAGFTVHVPTVVPANDGGVSIGQAWIAAQSAVK